MCKILFQNGSSLIFCIAFSILFCQKAGWLFQCSIFSNFFFYIQLTAAVKGVQDLNVSKFDAKELSGLKDIKGVEYRGVGDTACGEQGEQQGDGQGRHGEGDAGGEGGAGAGEEGAEIRGVESEKGTVGWKVKALRRDEPDVGGGEGEGGGEASSVGRII